MIEEENVINYGGISDDALETFLNTLSPDNYKFKSRTIIDNSSQIQIYILSPLGTGISGTVYSCFVTQNLKLPSLENLICAIKIFKNENIAQNEIAILSYILQTFKPEKNSAFPLYFADMRIGPHIAVLMELGGPTIFHLNKFRTFGFSLNFIRFFLKSVLEVLAATESKGLVHSDIKPENVLFSLRKFKIRSFDEYTSRLTSICDSILYSKNKKVDFLICDWSASSFGMKQHATYMQTRYYRAPEVILRTSFGPQIDIWSLGCVAVELLIGHPLFPGESEYHMLNLIQEKLGPIPTVLLKNVDEKNIRFSVSDLKSLTYIPGTFENFISESTGRNDLELDSFLNLLRRMLQLNPDARISAATALLHPFLNPEASVCIMKNVSGKKDLLTLDAQNTKKVPQRKRYSFHIDC